MELLTHSPKSTYQIACLFRSYRGREWGYCDVFFDLHKLNTIKWSFELFITQNVAKWMANLTSQLCSDFLLDGCLSSNTKPFNDHLKTGRPEKKAPEKADWWTFGNGIHLDC